MAQLIVRNINESVKTALRQRAKKHGHSMEEEAREILSSAVALEKPQPAKLGTWFMENFTGIGFSEDIPEFRGQFIPPASFDE